MTTEQVSAFLQQASALAPIAWVSIPDRDKMSTWTVHYEETGTQKQIENVEALKLSFVPPAPKELLAEKIAKMDIKDAAVKEILIELAKGM